MLWSAGQRPSQLSIFKHLVDAQGVHTSRRQFLDSSAIVPDISRLGIWFRR